MIIKKEDIAIVVVHEESDGRLDDFRIKFKSVYKDFDDCNVVIDMTQLSRVNLKDVMEFTEISAYHKTHSKKSFVMVVGANAKFNLPETIVCAPTLQEGLDLVEMEEIERDLGFL